MENKNFQKIVSSLIIVSLAFMIPYFHFAQVAKAQGMGQYFSGGMSKALLHLPLCSKGLVNNTKTLFSGGGIGGPGDGGGELAPGTEQGTDPAGHTDGTGSATSVSGSATDDLQTRNTTEITKVQGVKVTDLNLYQAEQKSLETNKKILVQQQKLANNDTCLKSIGRLLVRMLLQKLTLSTVNWINGGMDGQQKFISDPEKYFFDIRKDELLGFGNELNNKTDFPYAKAFLQNEAISLKRKFANNAKYSFDNFVMQSSMQRLSTKEFQTSFANGGWYAWDAMIQNEANNPLGFALIAQNELAKRIESKTDFAKGSLQTSGGFFGMQKCVDPVGVTKEQDTKARKMGFTGTAEEQQRMSGLVGDIPKICNKWVTVTPGKMVADAATETMKYSETALLNVDDLNGAIAAIYDALLNGFTSKIQTDGFSSLSASPAMLDGSEGQFITNPDYMMDYNNSQITKDFSNFQIEGSTFLLTHPDFNIRTDLNQGLIDEQRIFVDKLSRENIELKSYDSTVVPNKYNGWLTGTKGLIPTIYQLDYCIPGPHPGFENDSSSVLSAVLDTIVPEDTNSVANKTTDEVMGVVKESLALAAAAAGAAIGATVGTVLPLLGNIIGLVAGTVIGYIVGKIAEFFDDKPENRVKSYYAGQFFNITGDKVMWKNKNKGGDAVQSPALYNFGPFSDALYEILNRYINIINDVYNPRGMPSVTGEASTKFSQIRGYEAMYKTNEDNITSMNGTISRLVEMKNDIDRLNAGLKSRAIDQDAYEAGIQEWIPAFSRISASMVSGDDIARADKLIKQIVDERDYVYKNLLKGPNGCEQELAKGDTGFPVQVYEIKRMTYPTPILYDYNKFGLDEKLPDPYDSGYKDNVLMTTDLWAKLQAKSIEAQKNMPGQPDKFIHPGGQELKPIPFQKYGPGFLSLVRWESTGSPDRNPTTWCGDDFVKTKVNNKTAPFGNDMHVQLCLHDLFEVDPWDATIGQSGGEEGTGIFETMIGVY